MSDVCDFTGGRIDQEVFGESSCDSAGGLRVVSWEFGRVRALNIPIMPQRTIFGEDMVPPRFG